MERRLRTEKSSRYHMLVEKGKIPLTHPQDTLIKAGMAMDSARKGIREDFTTNLNRRTAEGAGLLDLQEEDHFNKFISRTEVGEWPRLTATTRVASSL